MQWIWLYFIAVNLLACAVTVWDKRCARRGARRVPEARLWLIAALGGAPMMLFTMCRVRHKTRHASFMWGLPALMLLQAAVWVVIHGNL